ncbi:MAG: hypothetical protein ACK4GC_06025 [Paracoccaceae bacterium]
MTIHTPITGIIATEAPLETAVSRSFVALLQAQVAFVLAERDLDDVGHSRDPAYRMWERDAELAQERLTEALSLFHDLPHEAPEDRPLRRMAQLVDSMLGEEEPGGARQLFRTMQITFFRHFQASGIGATAMHRNALLIQARHVASAIAALPLFDYTELHDGEDNAVCDEAVAFL